MPNMTVHDQKMKEEFVLRGKLTTDERTDRRTDMIDCNISEFRVKQPSLSSSESRP